MSRFLPRSLVAQMALVIGIALFVAQLVNFGLILNEREKASLAQNHGPAITRFVSVAEDYTQAPADFRFAVLEDNARRGATFAVGSESAVAIESSRYSAAEARLRTALNNAGINPLDVRAASRLTARSAPQGSNRQPREVQLLLLSVRLPELGWLNGQLIVPRADPWLRTRLAVATLALFVIVLGATLLAVNRLVRPLRDLTSAAERFGGRGVPRPVRSRGPADIRKAIDAFNAMNGRVESLLDEKDRMLGAIGHDLRTPLASLRIRAENVEVEVERLRMVAIIEEMTAMLEDILVLARTGRAREQARRMDVSALADTVAEEARELGWPVTFEEGERCIVDVQPLLMRRALRNLIDNAVKYGGSARVSVTCSNKEVRISVTDEGPGLPDAELGRVMEPFYRMDESRSRDTGGAGLGLPIARAIAESHGGSLMLRNTPEGLSASIVLPELG